MLDQLSDEDFLDICVIMWGKERCLHRSSSCACPNRSCLKQRAKRLVRYRETLDHLVLSHAIAAESTLDEASIPILHDWETFKEGLRKLISCLRSDTSITRSRLRLQVAATVGNDSNHAHASQQMALDTLLQAAFSLNTAAQTRPDQYLELGLNTQSWRDDEPWSTFIDTAFPEPSASAGSQWHDGNGSDFEGVVTAHKLLRRAGLQLYPTNNLRDHLLLDRRNHKVLIFHHAAFLKEHLHFSRALQLKNVSMGAETKIPYDSGLPRSLLVETLDTIQRILFPESCPKSRAILRQLSTKGILDQDCLRHESAALKLDDELNQPPTYKVWASRLNDLLEELESPRPKGVLELWLEERSAPRYMMLATLIGVMIAILLGFLGLIVTSYQTWIAYQAWKHPISS